MTYFHGESERFIRQLKTRMFTSIAGFLLPVVISQRIRKYHG